ncbi:MAG: ribonuclease T [Legionellaceae bacterium]|nr:ribonuclease T [Legionellaceae bacterium]
MKTRNSAKAPVLRQRFRGFLPVVVDIETAGVNPQENALLEIAIVLINVDAQGRFYREQTFFEHVLPFAGAVLDQKSLDFNQIDPWQPLRFAVDEKIALARLFQPIEKAIKQHHCQRAVLVGHNAWFDLLFLKSASKRSGISSPFHAFTCFDTATLSGLFFGQTVLAKSVQAAGLEFHQDEAHSAIYDAEITADLYCNMLNRWESLQEP